MIESLLARSEQKIAHNPSPSNLADDRVLVAAARRDPRAFGALYERYVGHIYRYAFLRLHNPAAAQDATSQTFLNALQGLSQFRDGVFIAWLYRIAHNVVMDLVRRTPVTSDFDAMQSQSHTDESPLDHAIRSTEREAFYRAMNDLPAEQRAVLDLTLSGFKGEEIAQMLGKTHAAVKMLRWRGMEGIKTRVAGEGFLETPGAFQGEVTE